MTPRDEMRLTFRKNRLSPGHSVADREEKIVASLIRLLQEGASEWMSAEGKKGRGGEGREKGNARDLRRGFDTWCVQSGKAVSP